MNFSDIKNFDLVNGEGVGISLFVSGCNINCPGCFNKKAQNFNHGFRFTSDTMDTIIKMGSDIRIDHLSVLGGEPLDYMNAITVIAVVKKWKDTYPNKPVWLWTGYELKSSTNHRPILEYLDYIVDGPYLRDKPTTKPFRGSDNQRLFKKIVADKNVKSDLHIGNEHYIMVI